MSGFNLLILRMFVSTVMRKLICIFLILFVRFGSQGYAIIQQTVPSSFLERFLCGICIVSSLNVLQSTLGRNFHYEKVLIMISVSWIRHYLNFLFLLSFFVFQKLSILFNKFIGTCYASLLIFNSL